MIKKTLCLILAACLVLAVPALAADNAPALRTSEAGIAFIKDKEGFAQTAYEDSLGWAIGYGTRCEPGEYPNGITEAEADALLRQHLAETESYIDSAMSSLGVTLNQHQYDRPRQPHLQHRRRLVPQRLPALQHALRGYTVLHR